MEYTVTIERMAYSADAVGHLPNGKAVFVEGAAPGDVARVELTEEKDSFARASLVEIEQYSESHQEKSAPRDLPDICPWQHLTYEAQLKAKRDNVVGQLVHTARIAEDEAQRLVAQTIASKRQWAYRNKLELSCEVGPDGKFQTGFRREGTDALVQADSTLLVHKNIQKAPKALRGVIRYISGSSDLGIYRIGVRNSMATGETEVALWTRPGKFPRALAAKALGQSLKVTSIVRVLADPGHARKIKGVEILDGRGYWRERIGNARFSTQAPSFFQVNTAQAGKLVDEVLAGLGDVEGMYVADLYAGGGTFSIPLALAGADVVAVEAAGSSVRDLRFNAQENGVDIDVVGGDAARELSSLGSLDALVVDPPRAGLAKNVPADIAQARPGRVVYVSCNPSTWARDVARFVEEGYRLISAKPVDMFPQTYHVEIVSVFAQ